MGDERLSSCVVANAPPVELPTEVACVTTVPPSIVYSMTEVLVSAAVDTTGGFKTAAGQTGDA